MRRQLVSWRQKETSSVVDELGSKALDLNASPNDLYCLLRPVSASYTRLRCAPRSMALDWANRPSSARLALLKELPACAVEDKVRVAGRRVYCLSQLEIVCRMRARRVIATAQGDSYSLILLEDDGVSILVDLRLCLASSEGRVEAFMPAIKSTVSVMGYVESLSEVRFHSLRVWKLRL
jgi:hypothetical protein